MTGSATPVYSNNINAGPATVIFTYAGDDNHTGNTGNGGFTITQATSTVTVTCVSPQTYTGSPLTPCSAVLGGAGTLTGSATAVYSNNTNAGAATVIFTYAGDTNHTGSTGNGGFTINKATPTATLSVTNSPQTYDGAAKAAAVSATSATAGAVANTSTGGAATQTVTA